jgi:hypothetical protein
MYCIVHVRGERQREGGKKGRGKGRREKGGAQKERERESACAFTCVNSLTRAFVSITHRQSPVGKKHECTPNPIPLTLIYICRRSSADNLIAWRRGGGLSVKGPGDHEEGETGNASLGAALGRIDKERKKKETGFAALDVLGLLARSSNVSKFLEVGTHPKP